MSTLRISVIVLALGLLGGCTVSVYDPVPQSETTVVVSDEPYIDTHLDIPLDVALVIEPYVQGYFSPSPLRYDPYLRKSRSAYDPYDQPCYARGDFNGDYYDDYAFLFSTEEHYDGAWWLTTKLLVVTSTPYGPELAMEMELGTVSASLHVPVEEYWAIGLLGEGTHTMTTYYDGVEVVETVVLEQEGFYLASLDYGEEALYYAEGSTVYEMVWTDVGLAKGRANAKSGLGKRKVIELDEVERNAKQRATIQ